MKAASALLQPMNLIRDTQVIMAADYRYLFQNGDSFMYQKVVTQIVL